MQIDSQVATLVVINPSGNRSRVPIEANPFLIGRQADNALVLRDTRASRKHAQIVRDGSQYYIEDLNSRHGVFLNGEKISRHILANSDRVEFGFQDSYKLVFTLEENELHRLLDHIAAPQAGVAGGGLSKLRALVEVARALQNSLSTDDVLTSVVDAALTVTGSERGFLLLRDGAELKMRVARDLGGAPLSLEDLKVPTSLINHALRSRRELLSMTFDPMESEGVMPERSVADLALRSAVCVPLVHVRTGSSQDTIATSMADTIGLLYMDSRDAAADLSAGNREILQTLALEASTILENARLLEEQRDKQRMEEELKIARQIQRSLLPDALPSTGWFRAAGSSVASSQVGGDYYDVRRASEDLWCAMVTDVSGKGVSSALLASLLQGAFLLASEGAVDIGAVMSRINRFLNERAKGEKYATAFFCTVDRGGMLRWANGGHPKPLLIRAGADSFKTLKTTGLPLGMMEIAQYDVAQVQLGPGDKVVVFSDGLSEAQNAEGEFFDLSGLEKTVKSASREDCRGLHAALLKAVEDFTEGADLTDDITLLVFEYQPVALAWSDDAGDRTTF